MDILLKEEARRWIEQGQSIVPVGPDKRPLLGNGWVNRTLNTIEDLEAFTRPDCSAIGLLLTHVADVDLDSPEAVRLAPHFLPETTHKFGRPGGNSEHWLYYCPTLGKRTAYAGKNTGMLVELRAGNNQTVLPPSPHLESGTVREWIGGVPEGLPPQVDATTLRDCVDRLAAAALLLRHYPTKGGRHD